ncbi:MAG: ABC transporter ATP-binding protein [Planctomycetes bacterium]|nr:ABC transporter ATP-binding protein [Planctomycetota bacterium]
MTLVLHGELQRGPFAARLDLEVAAGETLALVGPNGAGKSSCVQVLAGLVPLDRGELSLGGQRLEAPADGLWVPPEQRGVGYLPQEPLLFPHRSVLDNVAFGLRARGVGLAVARAEALAWLARVGIADLAQRRPRELSGGQAQRAALARALAPAPRLLLLDEPLAAVDASARLALRQELARHLASFAGPRVLVTHDAVDAFVLADRIAVLEQGRVVQVGTATEIGQRPRSRYVADLVGLNFLRGSVHDSVFTAEGLPADGSPAERRAAPPAATLVVATTHEGPAIATVHPRAIALFRERPSGSPRNVWQARVVGVEVVPTGRRVRLAGPIPLVAEVTAAAVAELGLGTDALVWIALKATEVQIGEA